MFIFPQFPKVNSPLQVKFYVRLVVNVTLSVVVERTVLTSVLDSVLQNLTSEFGVGFSGKPRWYLMKNSYFKLLFFYVVSCFHCRLMIICTSLGPHCTIFVNPTFNLTLAGPFIKYRKTLPLLAQVCDVSNNQS